MSELIGHAAVERTERWDRVVDEAPSVDNRRRVAMFRNQRSLKHLS